MALSEFMPYGAPELLDGARTRMARSTLFASLTVAMLFWGMGVILSHGARPLIPGIETDRTIDLWPEPFDPVVPQVRLSPPPPEASVRESVDPSALPVPVPDIMAPALDKFPPEMGVDRSGPAGERLEAGHEGIGPIDPPAADPVIGEFVIVDVYPSLVTSAEARYPDLAREAGIEGVVRVLMLVGLNGRVERAVVAPGGSVMMLDAEALIAARACVFTPALTNNHPVKVWVSRSYRFSLH